MRGNVPRRDPAPLRIRLGTSRVATRANNKNDFLGAWGIKIGLKKKIKVSSTSAGVSFRSYLTEELEFVGEGAQGDRALAARNRGFLINMFVNFI